MIVVVLGMHRSGTSLISGLLHNMGIDMGDNFKAGIENLKGYFEDRDFLKLNCKVLKEAGGSWRFPPDEKQLQKIINGHINEFKNLIEKKRKKKWGWKEPRTVLTIDGYMNFLPERKTKFIIVYRNPITVAKSLSRKKKHSVEIIDGLKLTNFYNRKIDLFIEKYKNYDKLFLEYESLLKDKVSGINMISEFVGVPVDKKNYNFIDNKLDRSSKIG